MVGVWLIASPLFAFEFAIGAARPAAGDGGDICTIGALLGADVDVPTAPTVAAPSDVAAPVVAAVVADGVEADKDGVGVDPAGAVDAGAGGAPATLWPCFMAWCGI